MRGDVALITGGASGIGRAIGEELARRGATVVLADRQLEEAQKVAERIVSKGGEASAVELDVREADAFLRVARDIKERFGGIDLFFNNAGIAVGGEVADYDRAAWDDVLDVNLRGVAYGVQAVYPIMLAQGAGHIVNTASMAGLMPAVGVASYAASKHAVVGMSKALRIEGAAQGVRVSVLCPGAIDTPILMGGRFGRVVGKQVSDADKRKLWKWMRPMSVDAMAKETLRQVARNEPYIIVPAWWKAVWLLERVSPKLSMAAWSVLHSRMRKEHEAMEELEPASAGGATAAHGAGR